MRKPTIPTLPPSSIPEVVEFIDAKDTLEEFKQEHAEVFEQFEALVDRYNTSLEQADKAVRAQKVTCGPFVLKHFSTKYDALALYNAVGRDQFIRLGGKIGTETTYDLDKGRFEAAVATNQVPATVLEAVKTESPNFAKVEKVVLP